MAAENGATDRQLMALYDWTSEKQANTYTAGQSQTHGSGCGTIDWRESSRERRFAPPTAPPKEF
jgi:hypothetical protein